ncbi:hypothetical protein PsorP6_000237 [Peronosclerospora sorghi]|uniref:Uncharacterized protein n=1 Tax=Peronosclerospora sorghi TaxID=230839 RepID=A0ACC0WRV7_9STRA|nr:hypothetical protein PsorP6_000237 [Peronosclerospora sorghi]
MCIIFVTYLGAILFLIRYSATYASMHQKRHRVVERPERVSEKTDDQNAPWLLHMLPSYAAFAHDRAADADGPLGVLASHADKQLPLIQQSELRRCKMPRNPRPVMSLEAATSVLNP